MLLPVDMLADLKDAALAPVGMAIFLWKMWQLWDVVRAWGEDASHCEASCEAANVSITGAEQGAACKETFDWIINEMPGGKAGAFELGDFQANEIGIQFAQMGLPCADTCFKYFKMGISPWE